MGGKGGLRRGVDQAECPRRRVSSPLDTGAGGVPDPTASGTGPEGAEFKVMLMVENDMCQRMAGTREGRPKPFFY